MAVALRGGDWHNAGNLNGLSRGLAKPMKICPQCTNGYSDEYSTCPKHGGLLSEIRDLRPGMMVRNTYRIVRKLGQGGMGTVYLAQHTLMDEPQALKFLSTELSKDEAFTSRFLREVRTLRQVRHKNVVDAGNLEPAEDGTLFFSMEFVDGPDLRSYFRNSPQPFPVQPALAITRGIAEGLGAAHALGMVHRDIKPENILMAHVGNAWIPKIADFGIVATKESSSYTQTGTSLLTPFYAAPEQWLGARAADLDGRTDLYALGGVLFEMLTGQKAFDAENYQGWAQQHLNAAPPPPSSLRPELAHWQGLDEVVLRLLAKDRNQRPRDVGELISMLDAVRLIHAPTVAGPRIAPPAAAKTAPPAKTKQPAPVQPVWTPPTVPMQQPWTAQPPAQPVAQAPGPKPGSRLGLWLGLAAVVVVLAAAGGWLVYQRSRSATLSGAQTQAAGQAQAGAQQAAGAQSAGPPGSSSQGAATAAGNPGAAAARPGSAAGVKSSPTAESKTEASKTTSAQPVAPVANSVAAPAANPPAANQPDTGLQAFAKTQGFALFKAGRYAEARPMLQESCSGGSGYGCNFLGLMFQNHEGVAQDYQKAAALYLRACNSGALLGCDNLGRMYQEGEGISQDFGQARLFYAKACDGGSVGRLGCMHLRNLYLYGMGVKSDPAKADQLLTKACSGLSAAACDQLKQAQ